MENNEIIYLLSEKKRLEALIKQYQDKHQSKGLSEYDKTIYEETKLALADILRRMNSAY